MKRLVKIFLYENNERAGLVFFLGIVVVVLFAIYGLSKNPPDSEIITDGTLKEADSVYLNNTAQNRYYYSRTDISPRDSLFEFDPNELTKELFMRLGFSYRQANSFIKYREKGGRFKDAEHFCASPVVSKEKSEQIKPYVKIVPGNIEKYSASKIDLNSADSIHFVALRGIGSVFAKRIIDYRSRLGGFVDIAQLKEVKGIDESNFEIIKQQFFVKIAGNQKIDINFAGANILESHPYIGRNVARRVLKERELRGGWNNLTELVEQDILLPQEAEKMASYVVFGKSESRPE